MMRLAPLARRLGGLALLTLLVACGEAGAPDDQPQRRTPADIALPAMKTFPPMRAAPPQRGNDTIARDFLALEFQMESGREVPRLTRFEGPVTVAMTGPVPPTAPADLAALLARLRAEAGIDIHESSGGTASITVEFIPRRRLQSIVPQAACFVVPGVSSFGEYRGARRSDRVDWVKLERRERAAIFIPSDTSPQEVRDCLHEELAQALGPLNDLYELSDSVFNDDNFHTILTGFDMLVLRAHYAPELANGMSRSEVAARLPAVLSRLHPAGGQSGIAPPTPTPRSWISAIERALGPNGSAAGRRVAAAQAVEIAKAEGWRDSRMAFSWFALGRLSMADELELAVMSLAEAMRLYTTLPDAQIHISHIDMQMAAFALSAGHPEQALELTNRAIPATRRAQNAALLASLLMIRAEAFQMLGQPAEAQALRLDSLGWARYGFGEEVKVRQRMAEIAVLAPTTGG